MTPYQDQDLSGDWEFKILRSVTGAFGKPEKLKEALDQEAKAGWVLVEKFDNGRIRLKRPASARSTCLAGPTLTGQGLTSMTRGNMCWTEVVTMLCHCKTPGKTRGRLLYK